MNVKTKITYIPRQKGLQVTEGIRTHNLSIFLNPGNSPAFSWWWLGVNIQFYK